MSTLVSAKLHGNQLPFMLPIRLDREVSVEEARGEIRKWMVAHEGEIGFVREIGEEMNGWHDTLTQFLFCGGGCNTARHTLDLIGLIPAVGDAFGNTVDLVVYRHRSSRGLWTVGFDWVDGPQPTGVRRMVEDNGIADLKPFECIPLQLFKP